MELLAAARNPTIEAQVQAHGLAQIMYGSLMLAAIAAFVLALWYNAASLRQTIRADDDLSVLTVLALIGLSLMAMVGTLAALFVLSDGIAAATMPAVWAVQNIPPDTQS